MRPFRLVVLLLLQLGVANAVYTLNEVEAQIDSYLSQNDTLTTRSALQSSCALAVRNPPGRVAKFVRIY